MESHPHRSRTMDGERFMKPMTLDEMKLAVCEKLPKYFSNEGGFLLWKDGTTIDWDWAGLQVCHEAEKLIDSSKGEMMFYQRHLQKVVYPVYHATYEQRLEALCRVWFPERFNQL